MYKSSLVQKDVTCFPKNVDEPQEKIHVLLQSTSFIVDQTCSRHDYVSRGEDAFVFYQRLNV